jgi:hypothetical protein
MGLNGRWTTIVKLYHQKTEKWNLAHLAKCWIVLFSKILTGSNLSSRDIIMFQFSSAIYFVILGLPHSINLRSFNWS